MATFVMCKNVLWRGEMIVNGIDKQKYITDNGNATVLPVWRHNLRHAQKQKEEVWRRAQCQILGVFAFEYVFMFIYSVHNHSTPPENIFTRYKRCHVAMSLKNNGFLNFHISVIRWRCTQQTILSHPQWITDDSDQMIRYKHCNRCYSEL